MVIAVTNPTPDIVREASVSDLPEIVSLINRAFEVERFFKAGDRTDAETIRQNMREGKFLVLRDGHQMIACVWIKVKGDRAYLGTLAVEPSRQKSGLGARMMREAEAYARPAGCRALDIRIVNLRTELPGIYRKFGFVESGTEILQDTKKFTQPVHFVTMSKDL